MKRLITLFLLLLSLVANSQKKTPNPNQELLTRYATKNLQEKLFIHTDKNFWIAGETSWFKVYLVNGQSHQPINTSRVAYLELVNHENQILLQAKVELSKGLGNGYFSIPSSIGSGNYYLRAYTRWMKNYSAEFYFRQPITIVNTFRRLFDTPQPVNSEIDIQFFPEGGQWIDGIKHKVAFRATDHTGKGIDFNGVLLNSTGDSLIRFRPEKFGIGFFEMIPSAFQDYTAIINHKGKNISLKLPKAKLYGFALQVTDTLAGLNIAIQSKDIADQSLYVLAHTRDKIKVASSFPLKEGAANLQIPKSDLDAGISHITVFNSTGQPVCERLVFTKPATYSPLTISVDPGQTGTRKKVTVNLETEITGLSNLSASVIRDDSLQQFAQPDIVSYLLLSSDLKGNIESPHDYLKAQDRSIDNLMLTHGWSRFRWEELSATKPVQYLPEYRGHLIEATVVDKQSQVPIPGVTGYISSPGKKVELGGAISNRDGSLLVETNHLKGTNKLILQSPHAQAKIEVKSPFSLDFAKLNLHPISLSEKNSQALIAKSISMQLNDSFEKHGNTTLRADSSAYYDVAPESYLLDDYTRFPVMEEVMREYVKSVWVRKKGDQFIFRIVDRDKGTLLEMESLVLLDGVPVFNVNDIMAFDPIKIKQLDVLPSRYHVGSLVFDGILSYRTYKGDLGGFTFSPETVMIDYEGLQQHKEFYSPRYETIPEINSRIPDGRHLLYWNPDVQINGNENKQLEFYTSDQPGTYKVIVQGIATDGTPLYGETTFKVVR
ncbi:MAG: hypothetical protein KIT62_00290 [Cyclobacteriaceae bacterium]|nr:hypothetical protein [Cyclobacteriaceae bacterium]